MPTPKIWFTSDTHFGHTNIIKYSKRPFQDTKDMDDQLIALWNSKVTDKDTVYHLGDFGLYSKREDIIRVRKQLKGEIHLIKGNHDPKKGWFKDLFSSHQEYLEIGYNSIKIVLCHYPIYSWNNMRHGSIHLHGHSHGNLTNYGYRIDVGVDCWNYQPVSIEEILTLASKRALFDRPDTVYR